MKLSIFSNITFLLIAALSGGMLVAAPRTGLTNAQVATAEDWSYSEEASSLLKDIRGTAARLKMETNALESYTRGGLSWESHAGRLNAARNHINDIGKMLQRLQDIRSGAAPWQRQATDSLTQVAMPLAARTQAAIDHLNGNQLHLWAPEYVDHLKTMADQASQMKKSVDAHLELADMLNRVEDLRTKTAKAGS